ncbi:MAG: hypothetical protein RR382_01020, partial [Tannerellaceae bacterium]
QLEGAYTQNDMPIFQRGAQTSFWLGAKVGDAHTNMIQRSLYCTTTLHLMRQDGVTAYPDAVLQVSNAPHPNQDTDTDWADYLPTPANGLFTLTAPVAWVRLKRTTTTVELIAFGVSGRMAQG